MKLKLLVTGLIAAAAFPVLAQTPAAGQAPAEKPAVKQTHQVKKHTAKHSTKHHAKAATAKKAAE